MQSNILPECVSAGYLASQRIRAEAAVGFRSSDLLLHVWDFFFFFLLSHPD